MSKLNPRRLFATPRRAVGTTVALFALVIVSAAAAAWFAGVFSGSIAGHTAPAQSIGALTFTPGNAGDSRLVQVAPGTPGSAIYSVSNPTSTTLTITSATAGAITATNGCDTTGLHFDASLLIGRAFTPGTTTDVLIPNAWTADPSTSTACEDTTLSVAVSGATSG